MVGVFYWLFFGNVGWGMFFVGWFGRGELMWVKYLLWLLDVGWWL